MLFPYITPLMTALRCRTRDTFASSAPPREHNNDAMAPGSMTRSYFAAFT